jgi:ABC-type Fe3+/spermidine/putrescine transport system ATPase subunit
MIKIDGLKKSYGSLEVLSGINLQLKQGEILCVIGASGCGKTTLLRLIAGLENPDAGKISIDGSQVSSPRSVIPPFKRNLSMIFQDLALWPHMTVFQNVAMAAGKNNSKKAASRLVNEMLGRVNLEGFGDKYPHQLSGGEKQRLAIARSLVAKPGFLLMDEPLSNLDPILKQEVIEVIKKLMAGAGPGVIYVTHNMEEVFALADTVAFMDKGRIVKCGTCKDVFESTDIALIRSWLALNKLEPDVRGQDKLYGYL